MLNLAELTPRSAGPFVVAELLGAESQKLQLINLGLGIGSKIRVIRPGNPMIVQVYQTCVGLSRSLAQRILVCREGDQIIAADESPRPEAAAAVHAAASRTSAAADSSAVVLLGNPNTGKTTLFNQLTGLRAKTANFPGTTLEVRQAGLRLNGLNASVVDLPGLYSLQVQEAEQRMALEYLAGRNPRVPPPRAAIVLVDAANPERSLYLLSQVREIGLPHVVALNMYDVAQERGMSYDVRQLERELVCPVVEVVAPKGRGIERLREALLAVMQNSNGHQLDNGRLEDFLKLRINGQVARYQWAEDLVRRVVTRDAKKAGRAARGFLPDRVLTHPAGGMAGFALIVALMFYTIFSLAALPMEIIDFIFGYLAALVAAWLPAGLWRGLITDGIIPGFGGVLIFLPQIALLFFLISLLEDSGYLARGAFVVDRLMRKAGLPGKAFIPILSAHACAIPAIMSARAIDDSRDRLITILVLPLMTCSARLPVYTVIAALLFPGQPLLGALLFSGAYLTGLTAAFSMAWLFRRVLVSTEVQPLLLELPAYRWPSLKNALLESYYRSKLFVLKAGHVILTIAIALWWLASFPRISAEQLQADTRWLAAERQWQAAQQSGAAEQEYLELVRDAETARVQTENSFAGGLGKIFEPVVRPLGFDWRIGIGIITSFAAREVVVSTLAVLFGVSAELAEEDESAVLASLAAAKDEQGRKIFNPAACVSLLLFFVLAMQCLPTQAVTRRETGSWKWAGFQIAYMSALAYGGALIAYQALALFGLNA